MKHIKRDFLLWLDQQELGLEERDRVQASWESGDVEFLSWLRQTLASSHSEIEVELLFASLLLFSAPASAMVDFFSEVLSSQHKHRILGAHALCHLFSERVDCVALEPVLFAALQEQDEPVFVDSLLNAPWERMFYVARAIDSLYRVLCHQPEENLRIRAMSILSFWGPFAAKALPELLRALESPMSYQARVATLQAIPMFDGDRELVSSALVKLLATQEEPMLPFVCLALQEVGGDARAFPKLLEMSVHSNPMLRIAALQTVAATAALRAGEHSQDVRRMIEHGLRDESLVRIHSIWLEYVMGGPVEDCVARLVAILESEEDVWSVDPKEAACLYLGKLGKQGRSAVRPLLNALERDPEGIGFFASHALGEMHVATEWVVPSLVEVLRNASLCLRQQIATTLCVYGEDSFAALPVIAEHFRELDRRELVNEDLALFDAIESMGVKAYIIAPLLDRFFFKPNPVLRQVAARTIGRIAVSKPKFAAEGLYNKLHEQKSLEVQSEMALALVRLSFFQHDITGPLLRFLPHQMMLYPMMKPGEKELWHKDMKDILGYLHPLFDSLSVESLQVYQRSLSRLREAFAQVDELYASILKPNPIPGSLVDGFNRLYLACAHSTLRNQQKQLEDALFDAENLG